MNIWLTTINRKAKANNMLFLPYFFYKRWCNLVNKREIRFTIWIISITSILYGITSVTLLLRSSFYGQYVESSYAYAYYIPFLMLIVFGVMKITGLLMKHPLIKRISIVGLMFSWGFIWTANTVGFFVVGPNRGAVLVIPILAICIYLAMRGDYIE